MNQIILITGANRGIGKGLTAHYLARPNITVIATVRDASSEKSTKKLHSLQTGHGSQLRIVSLKLDDPSSATKAASDIRTQHGIEHIDIVLANAGICDHWGPVTDMTDADVHSHMEVNTVGLLRLFKATTSFLQKTSAPKFVYISSIIGSVTEIDQVPFSLTAAYGMSKAAANYMVKRIDTENEYLIALSISPGLVRTDMGHRVAQLVDVDGIENSIITIDESVRGIVRQVDAAELSTTSGQFVGYNGDKLAW